MSKKLISGLLVGAAVGAVLGILFAPDKGTETRKRMAKKTEDLGDELKSKYSEAKETIREKFEKIKTEAEDMMEHNAKEQMG
jgi:gas vesicle protein